MSTAETTTIAASKPEPTTTVDLVIRLQIKGSPAEIEKYRDALGNLACVMAVQAEDGLWSLGHEDAETDDGPSKLVANIERTIVQAVLIEGSDDLVEMEEVP